MKKIAYKPMILLSYEKIALEMARIGVGTVQVAERSEVTPMTICTLLRQVQRKKKLRPKQAGYFVRGLGCELEAILAPPSPRLRRAAPGSGQDSQVEPPMDTDAHRDPPKESGHAELSVGAGDESVLGQCERTSTTA